MTKMATPWKAIKIVKMYASGKRAGTSNTRRPVSMFACAYYVT